ncbi:MAG: hypothetical protein KJ946_11165 [Gammaproteobacteria bacterium]|nr:hypothetical protein [Gammaproteobacteria bacterium]
MADLDLVISELREKIAQKRRELDEQEQALALLEKFAGASGSGNVTALAQDMGVIRLDELDLMGHAGKRRGTLVEDVIDVVKRLGDQEFSIIHIDALLKKMGKVPEEKSVRSRISSILSKLEEEGELERTFTGKGNVPHRYRRKQREFDLNEL